MTQLNFPETIQGTDLNPKLVKHTTNLMNIDGGLVKRPGMFEYNAITNNADRLVNDNLPSLYEITGGIDDNQEDLIPRALFEFNGEFFCVLGSIICMRYFNLGFFTSNTPTTAFVFEAITNNTSVPFIEGTQPLSLARGYNGIAIAAGDKNYFLSDAVSGTVQVNGGVDTKDVPTFAEITDPDLPPCKHVTRIDGYFIWTPTDGGPLFRSEVNDAGNVEALSFFDAETNIDQNMVTASIRNDLFVFGSRSIERFRNVGPTTNPFVRVNNSIINVGYVTQLVETNDSVFFIGRDSDGAYKIYNYAGGNARIVSSPAVDYLLAKHRPDTNVRGERFSYQGQDALIFSLLPIGGAQAIKIVLTLGNTPSWSFFTGTAKYQGVDDTFSFSHFTALNIEEDDGFYCMDQYGVYLLTERPFDQNAANRDYLDDYILTSKVAIESEIHTFIRDPDEADFTFTSVEISNNGPNWSDFFTDENESGSYRISTSQNGKDWGQEMLEPVIENVRTKFQPLGGFGQYEGYAGIRIRCTDNIPFNVDNIVFK